MNGIAQILLAALLTVPPPPVVTAQGPHRSIALFEPGPVRCSGTLEGPLRIEEPVPVAATFFGEVRTGGQSLGSIRLQFRIDSDGRPLGISEEPFDDGAGWIDASDVVPAFASWRFRPGAERRDCEIAFAIAPKPLETVPARHKARYLATPEGGGSLYQEGSLAAEAFEGLMPAGSTCSDAPRVGVRTWTYVDPEDVPLKPGSLSFAQILYDVSGSGWAANVRIAQSSGNRAFDRAAAEAMSASRFAGPPRKGCTYVSALSARKPMAAPPPPALDRFERDTDICRLQDSAWAELPVLSFPEPFRRRAIEGWAIVRYDVAPWGSVGNMSIVAAEPAEAFGKEAMRILGKARRTPSKLGRSGCLQTLIFDVPSPESGNDLASLD